MKKYPWIFPSKQYFREEFAEVLYQRDSGCEHHKPIVPYLKQFTGVPTFQEKLKDVRVISIVHPLLNVEKYESLKKMYEYCMRPQSSIDKVMLAMKKKIPMHMPIALYLVDQNKFWLLAGNIRVNVSRLLGYTPEFIVFNVGK